MFKPGNGISKVLGFTINRTRLIALALLSTTCPVSIANPALLLELQGEVTQGSLMVGKTQPGNQVYLDDRALKVSRHGLFTFGFSRDDDTNYQLKIKSEDEQLIKSLKPAKREYNIQRVNGIAKKIMNPDPKDIERARQDSKQIGKVRSVAADNIDFAHGFIAPSKGRITGVYGSQRVYNGKPGNPHYGLDYAGKTGTVIQAPAAGVVTLWVPDMFYSGGTLVIDHGHGVTSTFLHLSGSLVKEGDNVLQGQKIAKIGSTGRSTGPHLDWRVNWFNVKLDPALVLTLPNMQTFN
ncbi:M23 family metallopeptidase [Thalassotalea mangrovi]|uniref:M23 family metallopeptidase n=1 Tax=Thalassotalea mangrovi TaxID=2572245 RepID=A0A4U1B4X0_9GAMM|nr:M23 family metallopeptidase [Thalassotalea mangrovi]TKB44905.1 M23 family metallopeptidase [Thalassotalea mangrovi]